MRIRTIATIDSRQIGTAQVRPTTAIGNLLHLCLRARHLLLACSRHFMAPEHAVVLCRLMPAPVDPVVSKPSVWAASESRLGWYSRRPLSLVPARLV
jgi:hypothetical protein